MTRSVEGTSVETIMAELRPQAEGGEFLLCEVNKMCFTWSSQH